MAGTPTPNYQIPIYADTDAPNLAGAYNQAMGKIDTQLKANETATTNAAEQAADAVARVTALEEMFGTLAKSKDYTVADLAASGITAKGIVIKPATTGA